MMTRTPRLRWSTLSALALFGGAACGENGEPAQEASQPEAEISWFRSGIPELDAWLERSVPTARIVLPSTFSDS